MKRIVPWIALLMLSSTTATATDLRGRVDTRNNANGYVVPRAGASVALYVQAPSGWTLVRQTQSGSDGMYFLLGIAPGTYGLQVNGLSFPLEVSSSASQDIQPVLVQ